MRSRLIRLAVMLATQPDANFRRAFAMSIRDVRTGTPTPSTLTTSVPSIASATSRSWIITSKMTSMSRLRSGNPLSRWTSMKRAFCSTGRAACSAGLKRSVWPTAS